jgi:uncharacterized protein YkwD
MAWPLLLLLVMRFNYLQAPIFLAVLASLAIVGCGKKSGGRQLPKSSAPQQVIVVDRASLEALCVDEMRSNEQTKTFRQEVCILVNEVRVGMGLNPVTLKAKLSRVSQNHAAEMFTNNFLEHTDISGREPTDRIRASSIFFSSSAENIARGQETPEEVMNAWMNSPAHKANIINSAFKNMGVGFHQKYWVQNFTD